jgi:hypothetical protein
MNLLTNEDKNDLLHAILLMEDKHEDGLNTKQYAAIIRLCQEVNAPQFITEYFARKFVNGNTEVA